MSNINVELALLGFKAARLGAPYCATMPREWRRGWLSYHANKPHFHSTLE